MPQHGTKLFAEGAVFRLIGLFLILQKITSINLRFSLVSRIAELAEQD